MGSRSGTHSGRIGNRMWTASGQKVPVWLKLPALLLVLLVPVASSANILVVPMDGSHWVNMRVLMKTLHAHGHSLSVLHSSNSFNITKEPALYRSWVVQLDHKMGILEDPEKVTNLVVEMLEMLHQGNKLLARLRISLRLQDLMRDVHAATSHFIVQLFEDAQLMRRLEEADFKLVLTDPLLPVGQMLARRLGVPLVYNVRWVNNGDGHHLIAPSPISYVPVVGSWLTDRMSFGQRLANGLFYAVTTMLSALASERAYNELCRRYVEPGVGLQELTLAADLWLFRVDFVLDFPRPTVPNVVYVGGFQCLDASPMEPELEAFMQGSGEHGVVFVSLGLMMTRLPAYLEDAIFQGLAGLPHRVIWRRSDRLRSSVGNNTRVIRWVSQNDVLGHAKTVAFVSHGGTNGLYEAIYHGVPVIGLPLLFDQFDNLLRLEVKGAAKVLDAADLSAGQMESAVREVTAEPRYRRAMRRLSSLHRDQPSSPLRRAVFWIEYVLRHGGAPHLRPAAFDMPWYVYHSLDVAVFLVALSLTALLLPCLLIRRLFRSRRADKRKTD
ncbi:UDP-glucuronosyltransferase 1A5-like isoform X2 [Narcine bancroftii]|uniref:UDP-glucuronosyltransferase 1A5-like isoform X2 n=1 Tax=Narcine bancroftii TaxID=1343680 RepID=UPI003831DFDD